MRFIFTVLVICGLVTGCASYEEHAAQRTARLREMYPPGMSKEEVQGQWEQIKPDFSALRPDEGWHAYPNDHIARKLQDKERATGMAVAAVDRYWGPDGVNSLCYCWYYYDAAEKLVDVEWQYKSD